MFRHLGLALCFLDILFIFFAFVGLFVGVCVFVFVPVFLSYILPGKGFLWIQHEYIKLFERTRLFASLTSSSVCWSQCLYMCVLESVLDSVWERVLQVPTQDGLNEPGSVHPWHLRLCVGLSVFICVLEFVLDSVCVGKGSPRLFERPGLPLCPLAGEAFSKPMGLPYYSYSKQGSYTTEIWNQERKLR